MLRKLIRLATSIAILLFPLSGCIAHPQTEPAEPLEPATQPATRPTMQIVTTRPLDDDDAAVLEAAFRYILQSLKRDEMAFISVGRSGMTLFDPPPGFIERLGDLPNRVKPVSAARIPRPYEKKLPNRYRGFEDPVTGQETSVYLVQIAERVSKTRVRVNVDVLCGPLCGYGSVCIFSVLNGKWTFIALEGVVRA